MRKKYFIVPFLILIVVSIFFIWNSSKPKIYTISEIVESPRDFMNKTVQFYGRIVTVKTSSGIIFSTLWEEEDVGFDISEVVVDDSIKTFIIEKETTCAELPGYEGHYLFTGTTEVIAQRWFIRIVDAKFLDCIE